MTETNEPDELQELTPAALNAKTKKNLLWIFIFAVIMIFAGLTSGYIVSQGGNFWVNIKMPEAFLVSTLFILLSSGFLFLGNWAVRKEKKPILQLSLTFAFIFGLLFGCAQFLGWGQLVNTGNSINGSIININGKYGKYFTLIRDNKEITFDNSVFYYKGEAVSEDLSSEMKAFSSQIMEGAKGNGDHFDLSNYGSQFILRYEGKVVTYANNRLQLNGFYLSAVQISRLWYFAENIVNDRGDFIMKGKYGEDFKIFFQGEALEYTNRTFYHKGQLLSPKRMNDLETQKNTASSYIYAFTIVHLLHWIGGVIALLVMFIKGLQMKYTASDYLGITLGSTYWHFLGILWLYLYAFLIFIH